MRQIYDTVTTQLKERDPKLLQHLFKELEWGLRYEVRERRFILDEKIKVTLSAYVLGSTTWRPLPRTTRARNTRFYSLIPS
jgi:hypothetical protein